MVDKDIYTFLTSYNISDLEDLKNAIKYHKNKLPVNMIYKAAEFLNPNRESTAAYYTDFEICNTILDYLPSFENKNEIKILEPSVGAGSFIPIIAEKYKDKSLEITLVDIDANELEIAELIFETYYREKYPNVAIRYCCDDYLLITTSGAKYDLIIGNPPYDKLKSSNKMLKKYKSLSKIQKSTNIFGYFLEKALLEAKCVSLVIPKSLLNSPEYFELREKINQFAISSILDFGEYGFKGVKIETINIMVNTDQKPTTTKIYSHMQSQKTELDQKYITDQKYPSWLLYRNKWFDSFAEKLNLGIFDAFRDRQIVNSMLSTTGKYRVLKSRNIGSNHIINIPNYDTYCDNINQFVVGKYLNQQNVVCIPNLSYYPRAVFLPKNTIVNGSVALLTLKDKNCRITVEDLEFIGTKDFCDYYRIARNFGTRSLNIDSNSVFFFGLKKEQTNEVDK